MSAAAAPPVALRGDRTPLVRAPRAAVRLVAFGALAAFGAQAWATMVRPEAGTRMLGAALAGVGLALVAAVLAALPIPRFARIAALAAVPVGAAACALLLAGVPLHLLDLESWGDLGSGLGQGIQALPGLNVPYRGVEEWNRVAMLLGGTLLAIAGVLVACWPGRGRPATGAVLLAVLYAVPAVQLEVDLPWLEGLAFALLLGAALRAERLAVRDVPLAAVVVLAAGLLALAVAPRLDGPEPWLDYEAIAQSLGERGTSTFSWDHSYGPIDWPRDGREVLRIAADTGSYWKATTLAEFDGRRWREVRPQGLEDDPAADRPRPQWVQEIKVSVRNLSTRQFVTAGTTLSISRSPRAVVPGAPGSFVTSGKPLRRGHAYLARSYVPRPRTLDLEAAGTHYPTALWPYLSMRLPPSVGGPPPIDPATGSADPAAPPGLVVFSGFGDPRPPLGFLAGRGFGERVGRAWLEDSAYERTWRLARRLRAGADSPYAYARAVQEHLSRGFTYSETPPDRPVPLDAFLFEDKIGYCQQFSGAMTLLLRMGGIPARVAAGFSPGTLDSERDEYVVRDLDAHSWVEAYFPRLGWIPFDPTPAVAPARAQLPALEAVGETPAEEEGSSSVARGSERGSDPSAQGLQTAGDEGGTPLLVVLLLVLVALLAVAAVVYAVLAARWRRRYGPDVAAAELMAALRRTGRALRPGTTLTQVQQTLRLAPDAASYVDTVLDARYGFGDGAPTRAQRRALRRELGTGLGLRGRLGALRALPPF